VSTVLNRYGHQGRWLLVLLGWVLLPMAAAAGAGNIQYPRTGFKLNKEVTIPLVLSIVQDNKGFLWFGNDNGLFRYDGYRLKRYAYSPNDPNSLTTSVVSRIFFEHPDYLWIRSGLSGLNRIHLKTHRIAYFYHNPNNDSTISSNRLFHIFQGISGTLWFFTIRGIDRFYRKIDPRTGQLVEYFLNAGRPRLLTFEHFIQQNWQLLRNKDVALIFGAPNNKSFFVFHPRREVCYEVQVPETLFPRPFSILCTFVDERHRQLWIGGTNGLLLCIDLVSKSWEIVPLLQWFPELQSVNIEIIWIDSRDRIWLFTERMGILVLDRDERTLLRYFDDGSSQPLLHGKRITAFLYDRSGILWVATDVGINKLILDQPPFLHVRPFPQVAENAAVNNCQALAVDPQQYLWIAADRRIHRMHIPTLTFEYDLQNRWITRGFPRNKIIKTLFVDSRGDVWIGLNSSRLFRYRPQTGAMDVYQIPGGEYKLVRSIMEDPQGFLWIGVDFPHGGIFKLDPETGNMQSFLPEPGNPRAPTSSQVWRVMKDRRGYYWFTYWGDGVDVYDPRTGRFYNFRYQKNDPHSISSNYVTSIAETSDGTVWLGTWDGGLNKVESFTPAEADGASGISIRFKRYTESEGLDASNQVGVIVVDLRDHLWLVTGNGLTRFDPQSERFKDYSLDDGLQSRMFNVNAFAQSPNGTLFFGGTNGFNVFHPDSFQLNRHVPPVVITGLTVMGEPAPLDTVIYYKKRVKIPYKSKVFSIEFSALDFRAPENNQFQYMLEGFDTQWTNSGKRRYVTYTNLDPGEYVFRVRAANNDGVWNTTGARLTIVITPPWYRTWWAFLIYSVLGGLLLLAVRWGIVNRRQLMHLRARKISHYKLMSVLGEGGMGVVYKSLDLNTRRVVALKLLNKDLLSDPENRNRFANEGRLLQSFSHPHIVKVYEVGETETQGFIAMEYLTGGTLKDYLTRHHPLPLQEVRRFLLQIADGLLAIHQQGIVHRDLKLANIMLDEENNIRIMDFGLSKSHLIATMTNLGTVIGTLGYVAPEQITGVQVDHRVDIFSFGVIMYELLTGEMPFKGENEMAMIHAIFNTQPPPPSALNRRHGIREWDEIVMSCLAKNPTQRFRSVEEIIARLQQVEVVV